MEHFNNPRNTGKMTSADGIGVVGDASCGDQLTIYIKVNNNTITDIRFLVFGCAASIATSSMMTELVKGKTIEEAAKITKQDIAEALDGLPPLKMHCSVLAVAALQAAIQDYEEKKSKSAVQKLLMSLTRSISSLKDRVVTHMVKRYYKS
jgi:nitrogen fixation NifU-like protein